MEGNIAEPIDLQAEQAGSSQNAPQGPVKVQSADRFEDAINLIEDQIEGLEDIPLEEAIAEGEGAFYVQGDRVVVTEDPVSGGNRPVSNDDHDSDEVGGSKGQGRDLDDFEDSAFVDGEFLRKKPTQRQQQTTETTETIQGGDPNREIVLALMGSGMNATQALEALSKIQGSQSAVASQEPEFRGPNPPEMPEGIAPDSASIARAIEEATEAAEVAGNDWDQDEVKAQLQRIKELNKLLPDVVKYEEAQTQVSQQAQNSARNRFIAEMNQHSDRVKQIYPDSADSKTVMAKAMLELDRVWEETGDPRWYEPKKPLLLAGVIAGQLGLSPNLKVQKSTTSPAPTVLPGRGAKGGSAPSGRSSAIDRLDTLAPADRAAMIDELVGFG